jgi:hypothetical protein
MSDTNLIDIVPNARPLFAGGPDPDSAIVEMHGHTVVVTSWNDPNEYEIGIYADYDGGDDPATYAVFPHNTAAVAEIVECLDDIWPEGTDWLAWADQWMSDHDLRIEP